MPSKTSQERSRSTIGAVVIVIALMAALVFFVPLVSTKTTPSGQFASLGSLPAYESVSCAVLGFGTGYWQTNVSSVKGAGYVEWSYEWSLHLSCPP